MPSTSSVLSDSSRKNPRFRSLLTPQFTGKSFTGVALLFKVLIMLEGTSRLLSPRFNLVELMQPYQQKLLWRRLSPTKHFQRFRRLYREWEYLAEVFPRGATDLLQQIQAGKFSVHLEHQRLEPSVNRLVWGMITSALFLGSSLLWSHEVPPLLGGVSVFGVTGCVLSLLLSLRLLRARRGNGNRGRSRRRGDQRIRGRGRWSAPAAPAAPRR